MVKFAIHAVTTTAIVLATIFILLKVPYVRDIVKKALDNR